MSKKKLAIVSTYGNMCGIAAYTHLIKGKLEKFFDVEILVLDQYLLRGTDKRVRKAGDDHIREIAARLKSFDAVNIQFEHGTFGSLDEDIYNRFLVLLEAAPAVSITMHTVLNHQPKGYEIAKAALSFKLVTAARGFQETYRYHLLGNRLLAGIRRMQDKKPVSVIMHTKRDARAMRYVHGLRNVYDHPLAFLSADDIASIRSTSSRAMFPQLVGVPSGAKIIGTFGFLSRYKNAKMLVRMMHLLPDDYHLVLFGAVHPNEIKLFTEINPYLSEVLHELGVGVSKLERLTQNSGEERRRPVQLSLNIDTASDLNDLIQPQKGPLFDRVHFMGAMDDFKFFSGMSICDAVVFPYLEVGQSASGPISQSSGLGVRVLAAQNHAFTEFDKYNPGILEFFDAGNTVELASRLMTKSDRKTGLGALKYNIETNAEMYRCANDPALPAFSPANVAPVERLAAAAE